MSNRDWEELGAVPADWNSRADVRRYVEHWLGEPAVDARRLIQEFRDLLRCEEVTAMQVFTALDEIPWRAERPYRECVTSLEYYLNDLTGVEQIKVMNNHRLFSNLSERMRRMIRNDVLARGDFRKLGVTWTSALNHLDDMFIASAFIEAARQTHCLECIQELGDRSADLADAFLFDCIERGIGPQVKTSEKTAEFLVACNLLATGVFTPEAKIELASEMIIMLVGRQSRYDREIGCDSSVRVCYTKLRTLDYLLKVIFGEMTKNNAGIMLRWAMGRHRHHQWVWERIVDEVKRVHHWQLAKVVKLKTSDLGVKWLRGNHEIVVLPAEGSEALYGKLEVGQLVIVPTGKALGLPAETGASWTMYRSALHPLTPPTQVMRDALKA